MTQPDGHPPDAAGGRRPWRPATRVAAFVAAAVLFGLTVAVGGVAFAAGAMLVGFILFAVAVLLAAGGILLVVVGLLGPSDAPRGEAGLEWTAERQGLPTDPEAYQDGGLAVATTTATVPEADAAAAYLNARNVPAWVDQGHVSTMLVPNITSPEGVRVMVPLGRLGDAQQALTDREPLQEADEGDAAGDDEDEGESEPAGEPTP
jgi:hypothetical protein